MQYLLGTKEISSLQAHQKGAALKKATGKSLREIGGHVHLNHRQLSRGVKAMEENRDAGVNGRPQSLNEEGVAIFVETIRKRMSVRVNTTHQEARELAIGTWMMVNKDHREKKVPKFNDKWLNKVFKQNGLSWKMPRLLEPERKLTQEQIEMWFDEFEAKLAEYDIDPRLLFNLDETMLDERAAKEKVATDSKEGATSGDTPSDAREHVTLLLNCNAHGDSFKSTVIFPLVNLPPLVDDIKREFYIAGSSSGWITSEILKTTIEGTFLKDLNEYKQKNNLLDKWTMLVLDNHSSREVLEDEEFKETILRPNKIVIHYLVPHSSHLLQPLDLSPNLRFKVELGKLKKRQRAKLNKMPLQEFRNAELLLSLRALSIGLSRASILDGWERTGLWIGDKTGGAFKERVTKNSLIIPKAQELEEIPVGKKRRKNSNIKINNGNVYNDGVIIGENQSNQQSQKKQKIQH